MKRRVNDPPAPQAGCPTARRAGAPHQTAPPEKLNILTQHRVNRMRAWRRASRRGARAKKAPGMPGPRGAKDSALVPGAIGCCGQKTNRVFRPSLRASLFRSTAGLPAGVGFRSAETCTEGTLQMRTRQLVQGASMAEKGVAEATLPRQPEGQPSRLAQGRRRIGPRFRPVKVAFRKAALAVTTALHALQRRSAFEPRGARYSPPAPLPAPLLRGGSI